MDGIFNLRDYSELFEHLHDDHRGQTLIYQFDIGLDETIRRHAGRPLSKEFGEDKIRDWYDGWQPFPWYDETRVGDDVSTEDLVASIFRNLSLQRSSQRAIEGE